MKIFRFIPIILMILCVSCQNEDGEQTNLKLPEIDGVIWKTDKDATPNLIGTRWKLESAVSTITGESKVLEGTKDCEKCYTLMFETNTEACGTSIFFKVCVDLSDFKRHMGLNDFLEIPEDSSLFRHVLARITAYSATSNKLIIFSDEARSYLIFKMIEP